MSPNVQVLLLIVGLIMFLAVHAEEEFGEIEESERSCAEAYKSCDSNTMLRIISLAFVIQCEPTDKCKKGVLYV
uniref:U5-Lycotoxin-Lsp1k_1 n=1 Tax=Lycosa sp. SGP-2016 TaxID=1905177 RepID=A0A482ZIQ9_9ARAC